MPRALISTLLLSALLFVFPAEAVAGPADATVGSDTQADAPPARKHRKKRKKRKASDGPLLQWRPGANLRVDAPIRVVLGAGGLMGYQVRDSSGPVGTLGVSVTPRLRLKGGLTLRAPLSHERRETFGFDLAQRETRAGLALTLPLGTGLRATVSGGLTRVDRPDWPDVYQPVLDGAGQPTGTYLPTDRYSFTAWSLTGSVRYRLPDRSTVEAFAEVLDRAYDVDPAYDPVVAPTHLVPADLGRLQAGVQLNRRALKERWRQRFQVTGSLIDYAQAYARDAGTGRTHAVPGGPPANPLQVFQRLGVSHRSSLWLKPLKLRLVGDLGYEHNRDTYDGYYTWNGWSWGVAARWRPIRRWALEAAYAGGWQGYAETGYQEGGSHLPLDDGSARRWDRKHRLDLTVTHRPRAARVRPFVTASYTRRETNFPDYVPYENPASRAYDIGFDYTNLMLLGGVELRL